MAITKENEIVKIEVVGKYKAVQIRTDTVIKEDDTEISRSITRQVIHPDISAEDFALQDSEVQAIANVVWTQAVKDAWAAHLASK